MGTSMRFKNQRGFSLIEILMVLILIAVLAAIAINSFVNFRGTAQTASLQADLKVLRTAIGTKYAQMQISCATAAGVFPGVAQLNTNNITTGAAPPCTAVQIPVLSEQTFVQGTFPAPPQQAAGLNTVIACTGAATGCTRGNASACDSTATFTNQWCYNPASGDIWLDSATVALEAL